jgi:hypothetical protein
MLLNVFLKPQKVICERRLREIEDNEGYHKYDVRPPGAVTSAEKV